MRQTFSDNKGQSLIGIVVVLVIVGVITGGLYYYLQKQIPEVSEIPEKSAEEAVKPEEIIPPTEWKPLKEGIVPPIKETIPPEEETKPKQISEDTTEKVISSCGKINSPGKYILKSNIIDTSSTQYNPCLLIDGTHDIDIDCQNHTLIARSFHGGFEMLRISNTKNFSVHSCVFTQEKLIPGAGIQMAIEDSENGEIYDNIIGGNYIMLEDTRSITFRENKINAQLQQKRSFFNVIANNTFSIEGGVSGNVGVNVDSQEGADNQIVNNIMYGKWDSVIGSQVGVDDNILLTDEQNDIVQNNTLKNAWDCAIETIGLVENTRIIGNVIENMGICGIGGWYWNSWKENIVEGNTISKAPRAFYIFHDRPLREGEKAVYFLNNVFRKNTFREPFEVLGKGGGYEAGAAGIFQFSATSEVGEGSFVRGQNIFEDNDFGKKSFAPDFVPFSMIIDGGGNICGNISEKQGYPLICN